MSTTEIMDEIMNIDSERLEIIALAKYMTRRRKALISLLRIEGNEERRRMGIKNDRQRARRDVTFVAS